MQHPIDVKGRRVVPGRGPSWVWKVLPLLAVLCSVPSAFSQDHIAKTSIMPHRAAHESSPESQASHFAEIWSPLRSLWSVSRWVIPLFLVLLIAAPARTGEGEGAAADCREICEVAALPAPPDVFAEQTAGWPFRTEDRNSPATQEPAAFAAPASEPYRWDSGNIRVDDPEHFPRIRMLDNENPLSFWCHVRPNVLNEPVPNFWDFYNIIATDRPDFTDAPFSVGRGVTIIETGYTFRRIRAEDIHIERRQLPEILYRHGLTDNFELRLRWNGYVMTNQTDVATGLRTSSFGGDDMNVGFKWELLQQENWRPMVTTVVGVFLPVGTGGNSANAVQPQFNVVLGWGLRRWCYFKMSTGVDALRRPETTLINNGLSAPFFVTNRNSPIEGHQSASLICQCSKRAGTFVEWFGLFRTGASDNRPDHFFDTGLYLYATPNVQFDMKFGTRLSNRVDELFTGAGLSVRY